MEIVFIFVYGGVQSMYLKFVLKKNQEQKNRFVFNVTACIHMYPCDEYKMCIGIRRQDGRNINDITNYFVALSICALLMLCSEVSHYKIKAEILLTVMIFRNARLFLRFVQLTCCRPVLRSLFTRALTCFSFPPHSISKHISI